MKWHVSDDSLCKLIANDYLHFDPKYNFTQFWWFQNFESQKEKTMKACPVVEDDP